MVDPQPEERGGLGNSTSEAGLDDLLGDARRHRLGEPGGERLGRRHAAALELRGDLRGARPQGPIDRVQDLLERGPAVRCGQLRDAGEDHLRSASSELVVERDVGAREGNGGPVLADRALTEHPGALVQVRRNTRLGATRHPLGDARALADALADHVLGHGVAARANGRRIVRATRHPLGHERAPLETFISNVVRQRVPWIPGRWKVVGHRHLL
jgi:hypothetical protein